METFDRHNLTIMDVAKLAGVSSATISRVISNKPGVSETTKSKILTLLKELDYHPSVSARSLARNKSNTIGLVIPRDPTYVFSNPYYLEILRGITELTSEHGYRLLISVGAKEQSYEDLFKSGSIDGMILTSAFYKDKNVARLVYDGYPFALIGRFDTELLPDGRYYTVDIDHVKAARKSTEYLISLGHKKIGYITGPLDYYLTVHRLQGYKEAMNSHNLEIVPEYIVIEKAFMQQNSYNAMMQLMGLGERPTAVSVFNDLMAIGALQAARELHLSIPNDVSIIGFDNIVTAQYFDPPLTTVQHHPYEKALMATKLLINDLSGTVNNQNHVEIPFEIIERDSCKPIK